MEFPDTFVVKSSNEKLFTIYDELENKDVFTITRDESQPGGYNIDYEGNFDPSSVNISGITGPPPTPGNVSISLYVEGSTNPPLLRGRDNTGVTYNIRGATGATGATGSTGVTGPSSLQAAYDGGHTIVTSGGIPVTINSTNDLALIINHGGTFATEFGSTGSVNYIRHNGVVVDLQSFMFAGFTGPVGSTFFNSPTSGALFQTTGIPYWQAGPTATPISLFQPIFEVVQDTLQASRFMNSGNTFIYTSTGNDIRTVVRVARGGTGAAKVVTVRIYGNTYITSGATLTNVFYVPATIGATWAPNLMQVSPQIAINNNGTVLTGIAVLDTSGVVTLYTPTTLTINNGSTYGLEDGSQNLTPATYTSLGRPANVGFAGFEYVLN